MLMKYKPCNCTCHVDKINSPDEAANKSNNKPPGLQLSPDDLLPTQLLIAIRRSLLLSKDLDVRAVQHASLLGEMIGQFGLFGGE